MQINRFLTIDYNATRLQQSASISASINSVSGTSCTRRNSGQNKGDAKSGIKNNDQMFCEAVFLSTMSDENYNSHCQPQRQYENSQKSLDNAKKKDC